MIVLCFFFFKQKTAYEMRISDWSSDVCSSDLFGVRAPIAGTLPVREASAPSGADAAPSAGKRLVAGDDCDGGVPRGTPSAGAAEEIGRAACRERVSQYV